LTSVLDGGEWSSSHPLPLYPQGKSHWYPLDRRLGGPQSRSVRGGEEENCQPLAGLESPIIQPVAQRCTTELSRFLILRCEVDWVHLADDNVQWWALENTGAIKRGEFLNQLRDYQLLKKDSWCI
jgi:hypothetical protein